MGEVSNEELYLTTLIRNSSIILHELDHYLFFKENNMIGVSGEELNEFERKYQIYFEKKAYIKMIKYYISIISNSPTRYKIMRLKEYKLKEGKISNKIVIIKTKDWLQGYIDYITEKIMPNLETIEKYNDSSKDTSIYFSKKIMNFFKINEETAKATIKLNYK